VKGKRPTPALDGAVLALDVDSVLLDPAGAGPGGWQQVVADRFGVDPSDASSSPASGPTSWWDAPPSNRLWAGPSTSSGGR